MTLGLYCMVCGLMWDVEFKEGKMINSDCPNKENHGLTPTVREET